MASRGNAGFRLLEWLPSQKLLVGTARATWDTTWGLMMAELAPQSERGEYVRPAPQAGSEKPPRLLAESGRYHLYVGNACPWCHRVTLTLALRGLGPDAVSVTQLDDDPMRASRGGWAMPADLTQGDPVFGARDLKGVYDRASNAPGGFSGRCTAPLLIDKHIAASGKDSAIVSSESADVVRALNDLDVPGDKATSQPVELRPEELREEIDAINAWTYNLVNNGVYRAGFATQQGAYEDAERDVHQGLAKAEQLLANHRFLCGNVITEADVRLLPTVERFDAVYATLFRCGRRTIRCHYPNLARWRADLRKLPGVASTFDLQEAQRSYFTNLFPLNPGGIVPSLPEEVEKEDDTTFDLESCLARRVDPVVA